MAQFDVIYPDDAILRTALRGAAAYGLSWFDAHLWAYAEVHGLPELLSDDFQHGRMYGTVTVHDPFRNARPARTAERCLPSPSASAGKSSTDTTGARLDQDTTVSIDDETYPRPRVRAADLNTSGISNAAAPRARRSAGRPEPDVDNASL